MTCWSHAELIHSIITQKIHYIIKLSSKSYTCVTPNTKQNHSSFSLMISSDICDYVRGGDHDDSEIANVSYHGNHELEQFHWQPPHPKHRHLQFEQDVQILGWRLRPPFCGGGELLQRLRRLRWLLRRDVDRDAGHGVFYDRFRFDFGGEKVIVLNGCRSDDGCDGRCDGRRDDRRGSGQEHPSRENSILWGILEGNLEDNLWGGGNTSLQTWCTEYGISIDSW